MTNETPCQDLQDLWSIYQATKVQYEQVAAEKLAVLAQLVTLRTSGTADAKSISQSGEGGSEAYTLVALQERFDSLTKAEIDLSKLMYDQRLHAIKSTPGIIRRRVSRPNFPRYW